MVPMGILVSSNFCAVMIGPIALMCKCSANRPKELGYVSQLEHNYILSRTVQRLSTALLDQFRIRIRNVHSGTSRYQKISPRSRSCQDSSSSLNHVQDSDTIRFKMRKFQGPNHDTIMLASLETSHSRSSQFALAAEPASDHN